MQLLPNYTLHDFGLKRHRNIIYILSQNIFLQTSMMFDISLGGDSDGHLTYHHPVLSPLPIKPFKLQVQTVSPVGGIPQNTYVTCELCILLNNILLQLCLTILLYLKELKKHVFCFKWSLQILYSIS